MNCRVEKDFLHIEEARGFKLRISFSFIRIYIKKDRRNVICKPLRSRFIGGASNQRLQ